MLPKACSIVFCQKTSNPKDSASVAKLLGLQVPAPVTPAVLRAGICCRQSPSRCTVGMVTERYAVHAYPD